jgi:hypothetical protein
LDDGCSSAFFDVGGCREDSFGGIMRSRTPPLPPPHSVHAATCSQREEEVWSSLRSIL